MTLLGFSPGVFFFYQQSIQIENGEEGGWHSKQIWEGIDSKSKGEKRC
jgi:hypothetical protein